jgi:hypothetical protein
MEPTQFRVLADYEVIDPHPLRLEAATSVTVVKVDMGWPGWVWVEAGDQSGWIPESFLTAPGEAERSVKRAFDGSDLSAKRGDVLSALEEAPGWIFARDSAGRTGWFPLFNLKPFQNT